MRKMSINFQLILFAFIIKSISSNNLVSKAIELINGNDSTKSSINAFINKHKDILDNISNDLLLLYNNNFDTKFLLNKKEYSEANSPLIFFVKLELENLKNKINNHTNISSILDEYNTKLSLLGSILNNNNISFHLENYEKYIIQLHQNYSQNIIDFIELLLQKNNTNHIKFVAEILMNYFGNTLQNYISGSSKEVLKKCEPNFINKLVDIVYKFIRDLNLRENTMNLIYEKEFKILNIKQKLLDAKISDDCHKLLNYTILENNEQIDHNTKKFYRMKLLDGNIEKNEFFNYEKCLELNDKSNKNNKSNYLNNEPAFVLSIIDGSKQIKNSKSNTYFEKYYFVITTCFPQGYEDESKKDEGIYFCSDIDYSKMIKITFESFLYRYIMNIDSDNLNITSLIVTKKGKLKRTSTEFIISIIAAIILLIPIIINLFLCLFKKIKMKNNNKGKIINKLYKDENGDEEEDEEFIEEEPEKVIFPKNYILLNYFFDFRLNIKELFNFKSNLTNINNMNGLNYIKGLIGISMIFIVFGHTYFILFNLPLKKYGQWGFYTMMSSIFYFIPMSGLRYYPRFILSCSGFTFTYKYLSFLDKKPNNYFLKFLFQQNHKYFLLILMFLGRPLSYYIHYFLIGNSPMGELLNYLLKKPKDLAYLFVSIISFKLNDNFKIKEYDRNSNDLLDYFWLAFNEILFFIIGLILISIGYKFKFRIDLIIIISFFVIYLLKIILYYIYSYINEGGTYPTLYYYIIDYGKIMLLPNFNLPYYLIGMFFGLMHYTVQKIMPEIEQNKQEITNLNEENNLFKDEEEKMIPKIDKNNNSNRLSYDPSLFSYVNKKEKEGFTSKKDLNNKLLDYSSPIKIKRNTIHKFSNKLKEKTNNLLENNISNDIEEDVNSIKKKDSLNDLDYMAIGNANDNKDNINKMIEMPFFKLTIPIIKWHKKHVNNMTFFLTILSFISITYLFFIFSYLIFFNINNLEKLKKEMNKDYLKELKLEDILTNRIFNFLYLIDIELVVLLLHWAVFIISIREQNRIYDFLRNDFWNFFTKSYFSYLLIINPVILYILYGNETIIKLKLYSIYVYSTINLLLILMATILVYTLYELPAKKIIKYIINKDYNNIYYEEENLLNGKDGEEN